MISAFVTLSTLVAVISAVLYKAEKRIR